MTKRRVRYRFRNASRIMKAISGRDFIPMIQAPSGVLLEVR